MHPRDIDRLTVGEFDQALTYLDQRARQRNRDAAELAAVRRTA